MKIEEYISKQAKASEGTFALALALALALAHPHPGSSPARPLGSFAAGDFGSWLFLSPFTRALFSSIPAQSPPLPRVYCILKLILLSFF